MNILKTSEQILQENPIFLNQYEDREEVLEAIRDGIKNGRDAALAWAAWNAKAKLDEHRGRIVGAYVDRLSILSGINHSDLEVK